MTSQPQNTSNMTTPDNMIEGYKQLCELLRHEESIFWKRIETFLLISTGLVGILGFFGKESQAILTPVQNVQPAYSGCAFGVIVSVIGIMLCLFWLIVVRRSEAFYNHWYEQLIFIENKYLGPLRVFNTADEYFEKGMIKLGNKELRLDRLSRIARIYHVMVGIPVMFLVVWVTVLIYLLYKA